MDDNIKVTAIITTYKRDISILERAINSIKKQTYRNIEILIVDDNEENNIYSNDIRLLCQKLGCFYLTQGENKGACSARNFGIKHSTGDYIGFLDDDDEWIDIKIEKQINEFKDEEIGIVFCNGIRKFYPSQKEERYNGNIISNPSFLDMLEADRIGTTSGPLIRKKCFEEVGGFWEEQPARQDYEMWIRIIKDYKAIGIDELLFIHNMHDGEQISKNKKKCYNGYKNIYLRYKDYYSSNKNIFKNFGANWARFIYSFSFFNIRLFYYRVLRKMKKILTK